MTLRGIAPGSSISVPVTVPNGGTGLTSGTSGAVPYFNSTTTMASSALLAANAIVLGGGAGTAPLTSSKLSESSTAGGGLTIAAGTGTTNGNPLLVTQTRNASGVTFDGIIKAVITDTASAAGSLAMQILGGASGTTELFKLTKSGALTIPAGLTIGAGDIAYIQYLYSIDNTTSIRLNQSNGIIQLASGANGSGFDRLQFGGTTSSFPAIKRSTTVLQARLADDSAAATFQGKYNSSDGTAGVASFGPGAVTSITIKDGIVTAIS